jgi:hypothetical protein
MKPLERSRVEDKLSSRVLDFLTAEVCKAGTREKLKCVVDPVFLCFMQVARPYIMITLVILCVVIACQGLLLHRMLSIERNLRI